MTIRQMKILQEIQGTSRFDGINVAESLYIYEVCWKSVLALSSEGVYFTLYDLSTGRNRIDTLLILHETIMMRHINTMIALWPEQKVVRTFHEKDLLHLIGSPANIEGMSMTRILFK